MLLVWENSDPALPNLYDRGELPPSLAGELAREPGATEAPGRPRGT
jgi:hypothetical protein